MSRTNLIGYFPEFVSWVTDFNLFVNFDRRGEIKAFEKTGRKPTSNCNNSV